MKRSESRVVRRGAARGLLALGLVVGLVGAAAPSLAGTTPTAAPQPAAEQDAPAPPGLEKWTGSSTLEYPVLDYKPEPGQMSKELSDGVWALKMEVAGLSANSFQWDAKSETLLIYSAEDDAYWAPLLERYFPGAAVKVLPAKHSAEEVEAALAKVRELNGDISPTQRIAMAAPAKDGSLITISVSGEGKLPSSAEISKLLSTEVPLVVEVAPEIEGSLRNNAGAVWLAGNAMSNPNMTCSTGFRLYKISNSAPGMLSAEHCGHGNPVSWQYSTWTLPTLTLGDFQGPLSNVSFNSDTALWTGSQLSEFVPAVMTGSYTDTATGEWVRGASYPAIGTTVCYSGAFSGRVCANNVVLQGLTVCYTSPASVCYGGITYTVQQDAQPAAGNGDSGGPVYQKVGGLLVASGVYSGRVGGSPDCTGEPGGSGPGDRQCSHVNLFAPVAAAVGTTSGWRLYYIP